MTDWYFAPPPAARTGVADYAEVLRRALEGRGPAPRPLYHIGNNQLHCEIYARALQRPGVVVLHDAVLQHFFLGSLDEPAYIEEFVYNYGGWFRDFARQLWRERARSALDPVYFRYPMLKRIAEASRAVVVHNPAAASRVRAHAPAANVVEIPHLFCAPEPAPARHPRVPPGAFVFGVFGHLRESKRLLTVLRAFQKAGRGVLLVAGDFVSSDLERAAAPLLERSGILRFAYTPEREFWRLAFSVDACINLRYPPAGETSGIAIRLMGIGKPVILSAGEEASRFPDDACLPIEMGLGEEELLADYMCWLAQYPETAREIGRRAQAHILHHHSLKTVAHQYWQLLTTG